MRNPLFMTITFTIILGIALLPRNALGQNWGCKPDECCSEFGYCGKDKEYCGPGCQSGPCSPTPSSGVSVPDIVTQDFFNAIINQAPADCPGKNFYSRNAFLEALTSYSNFGQVGSSDDSKREIAAFFAHATHETGYFCNTEEQNVPADKNYCDTSPQYRDYPCAPGKRYFGRGPLQLTWNYNYGPAGNKNNFDGLKSPEIVARDPIIAFKTAFWYWMTSVRPVVTQGFGATIKAIIGDVECGGKEAAKVRARIDLYTKYCSQIGASPGGNLEC
ncbi:hypothetical protein JCGZ_05736 [Jatropha curcas]|uniref:chitinase n=1 Tax=Jatropha curcas TaxID=180498 RepID=A0A067LJ50_JATCU|nr:hypothetical protein JCGZ_05736 [Jatropha curcas]